MENSNKSANQVSRRKFLGLTAAAAALSVIPGNLDLTGSFLSQKGKKPNSEFGGVKVGAITYSWRSMPYGAEDVLNYCLSCGISSIEMMGDIAEKYAGLPQGPARPAQGVVMSDSEKASYEKAVIEATAEQMQ